MKDILIFSLVRFALILFYLLILGSTIYRRASAWIKSRLATQAR